MNILFITSTRLGDAVLSTGILAELMRRYPDAEITVACGPLVAGLFAPCPQVKKVIALKKEPYYGHWLKLARQTFFKKWDIVVDLRNSFYSRLMCARKKYLWGKTNERKHKIEQLAQVIGAEPPPPPVLWFDERTETEAKKFIGDGETVIAVGPAANWPGKTWPAEHFIGLLKKITAPEGFLPDAKIAVIAAPGEEKQACQVLGAFPPEKQIDVIAKASPLLAAAIIKRCQFFVGNDSGLTHCAAAVGTPTLGLFGPSWPHLYRPWGEHAAYVSTPETYAQLTAYPGYHPDHVKESLMGSLTVEAAYIAASKLSNRNKF